MKEQVILEGIINSILHNDTVSLKDDWSIFAYIGDTCYHILVFFKGEQKHALSNIDLDTVCSDTVRFLNKETLTTLPPCNPASP